MALFIVIPNQFAADGQTKKAMMQYIVIMLPASILPGVLLMISFRWIKLVEFVGPLILLTAGLMILLINTEMIALDLDRHIRQTQSFSLCVLQCIVILFTGATYFPHMIFRTCFLFTWIISLEIYRSNLGDDNTVATNILFIGSAMITIEISIYSSYKSKAELFVRIQESEQQRYQLAQLLDAVPDSVFICSKQKNVPLGGKKQAIKAKYSNRKMTQFFGYDPTLKVTNSQLEGAAMMSTQNPEHQNEKSRSRASSKQWNKPV